MFEEVSLSQTILIFDSPLEKLTIIRIFTPKKYFAFVEILQ